MVKMRKKFGFTAAEVLITIGVVGVIAAITVPTLLKGFGERLNTERAANIVQKIDKSMKLMRADGKLLEIYDSTDAFVDELQKYLQISSRCDSEHIADCWPTKYVYTSNGNKYDISEADIGARLGFIGRTTKNVGLILSDGTSLILTYNPEADIISDGSEVETYKMILPSGFGRTKEYVYGSNVMSPIAFIMDTNGDTGPNREMTNGEYQDIREFGGAGLSPCAGCIYVDGIGDVKEFGTLNIGLDCTVSKNDKYCGTCNSKDCGGSTPSTKDNWAGANKTCMDNGLRLPTNAEAARYVRYTAEEGLPYNTHWTNNATLMAGNQVAYNFGRGYPNVSVFCVQN